jgi:hypothetical protein
MPSRAGRLDKRLQLFPLTSDHWLATAGDSRPKDGVASLAYVQAIPVLRAAKT